MVPTGEEAAMIFSGELKNRFLPGDEIAIFNVRIMRMF
jgi:hypothetical protein